ncbi:MAG: hypothetical protein Q9208_000836 [Pyrenodesmia sp. 3 TL-2023]
MGKKRKHLSHEEVWDDSALVDSWDAALQEYQLYHSIHARGERVEDVLKEAEAAEESLPNEREKSGHPPSDIVNGLHSEDLEDGEVEDGQPSNGSVALQGTADEPGRTEGEIHAELPREFPPATLGDGTQDAPAPSGMPGALMNGGLNYLLQDSTTA